MTNFHVVTPKTPEAISTALAYTKHMGVRGHYLEFGVYTGYSLWRAYEEALKLDMSINFFGFDSFEGLPELENPDSGWDFSPGQYKCSRKNVTNNLEQAGVDLFRIHLFKLWFEELYEWTIFPIPAAVVLVDCDLYHSTKPVLDFLEKSLQDNSVIIFDDWNCFDQDPNRGQRRAFREFLTDNPKWKAQPLQAYSWHGQSFIMRSEVG